jgi:protein-disulfide isomerase
MTTRKRNKPHATAIALMLLLCAGTEPVKAQSGSELDAIRGEIQALKSGQDAIQKDLAIIKGMLERQAGTKPPAGEFRPTDFAIAGSPVKGGDDAPVTMIEFTDYQCPFCRKHNQRTLPRLVREFVDSGKLRYVLREYPLESSHPLAPGAAEAALCAGDQGRYWEMNAQLFEDSERLLPENLVAQAEALGLDRASFKHCLDSDQHAERIERDLRDGEAAGIQGTPTFFLGLTNRADPTTFLATRNLIGAQPYGNFKRMIEELLAEADKN